jgi:hypothetical protein
VQGEDLNWVRSYFITLSASTEYIQTGQGQNCLVVLYKTGYFYLNVIYETN